MIFKDQSSLRIRLTTNVDITGASTLQIKYTKPSGTSSYWTATEGTASTGIIYYDIVSTEIDEAGRWILWAYVTFSDGRSAAGEIAHMTVHDEGTA